MIRIPVGDRHAIVDDCDAHLADLKWSLDKGYATAMIAGRRVRMHRVIAQPPSELVVDHLDRDGLNNTRSNLRVLTQAENLQNQGSAKGSSSRYRGVSFMPSKWDPAKHGSRAGRNAPGAWVARGRNTHLGTFATEQEAAADWRAEHMPYSAEAQTGNDRDNATGTESN